MIIIINATATNAYRAGCFSGHSPPLHIEKMIKFLIANAKLTAPINTFVLFAHTWFTKKHKTMMVVKNP